ncbi:hypothetical protein EWM64_g10693 [Hericium alpestre]|uniref:Uncharacterized protein n=1 Tax=Hericium alpestre TaxID=135208 RepID=A0A4Y9ZIP2_9AGAM|nr:hypothetical protein EWM64_g10693 [Hericium alpestre]
MINLLPGFSYFYLEPHVLSLFPRLAHLQITMMSEIYNLFRREYTEDVDELTTFWENIMVKNVLPAVNASSTLTSLVLHNKSSACIFPAVAFDALTFSHLTLLSLGRIVFYKTTGTEEFIIRHKSTLTELELYQCMVGTVEEGVSPRF